MPRDSGGNYTLPAGNPVVPGTIIESDWANDTMNDVKAALTDSLSRTGNGGMQVPFKATDGTAAAPSYTFTNNSQYGMFFDALTPLLGFSVAGANILKVLSAGIQVVGTVNGRDMTADGVVIDSVPANPINATGVTYENLNANSDVGTGATQVAQGSHLHPGVYEPADGTILKDADIGVTVEARDATILRNANIGVTVQPYNAGYIIAPISQGQMGAGSVGQSQIKTAIGEVSTAPNANLVLPGGEYGFYPRIKKSGTGTVNYEIAQLISYTSYVTNIWVNTAASTTGFAQQRYVQSSPPYKIGATTWGHFVFVLRAPGGNLVSAYEAEDPCWAYNGPDQNPKDSAARIQAVPHPFTSVEVNGVMVDPISAGYTVELIDMKEFDTKKFKEDKAKEGKSLIEEIETIVKPSGKLKDKSDYGLPEILGFTDKVKFKTMS